MPPVNFTPDQLQEIEEMFTRRLVAMKNVPGAAAPAQTSTIKVRQVNTNIEPPSYHHRQMTTDTFFKDWDKYFKAPGYDETGYHTYVGGVLKNEYKLWHNAVTSEINNWDDFKEKFKKRFDDTNAQRHRTQRWYANKQRLHDPCYQYVYEMYALGKQIEETASELELLSHIRSSLFPSIGLQIYNSDLTSLDSFLTRISTVHDTILQDNRLRGSDEQSLLPPMHGIRDEKKGTDETEIKANGSNGYSSNYSSGYNSYNHKKSFSHRGRSSFHDKFSHHSQSQPSHSSGSSTSSNYQSRFSQNTNHFNTERGSEYAPDSYRGNSDEFRGNSSRGDTNYSNYSSHSTQGLDNKCYSCQDFGHIARNCPQDAIVMCHHEDMEESQENHMWGNHHSSLDYHEPHQSSYFNEYNEEDVNVRGRGQGTFPHRSQL